ncbi:MAG: DNA replication and repair protein RecF, partial [Candidatus Coatesbacteria bacterium]
MRINRLHLEDYRNYGALSVDLPPGALLFEGTNGAGKTNLLEAVYFLSMCRSFRLGRDRDVVSRGAAKTLVRAEAVGRDGTVSFALEYDLRTPEKRASYNGNRVLKLVDYIGALPAVAFHPEDMEIVKGPPVLRRRFMDHWLVQYDRQYIYLLKRYNDALSQRNALLRSYAGSATARPEYDAITETMVKAGAGIVASRADKITELAGFAALDYVALTGDGEELEVKYRPNAAGTEDPDVFKNALSARAGDERRFKRTLVGPHLDDLRFDISGSDARRFASQGQQRTVVLALRLAQFRAAAENLGEVPLLLLDDAFSELDRGRMGHLAE